MKVGLQVADSTPMFLVQGVGMRQGLAGDGR